MKNQFRIFLAALCALLLSACVSSTAPVEIVPPTTAQTIANIVGPIAQGVTPLVLDKNPTLTPAFAILADAIPAAFATEDLSPESIGAAIHLLNSKGSLGLTPEIETLVSNALSIAITQYQQQYGVKVALATDPGVQLILTSFSTGLHNGVVAWQTAHK